MYRERLYFATGFSLIQCVKGLMSYEDEVGTLPPPSHSLPIPFPVELTIESQDLLAALNHARHGNTIASQHRKKQALLGSIYSVIHSSSSAGWIKSMTDVERHAELVYAESLFEKVCTALRSLELSAGGIHRANGRSIELDYLGTTRNRILRRLASLHQRSVRLFSSPSLPSLPTNLLRPPA